MVGLLSRWLAAAYCRSREKKIETFLGLCALDEGDWVLDVGVDPRGADRGPANLLERHLAGRYTVVGVSLEDPAALQSVFPSVRLVRADGCRLPFAGEAFAAVHANAVIEHVGDAARQRQFVAELVRVARTGFITTPNYWYPIELHTRIPLAHFLPWPVRRQLFRLVHGEENAEYMRHVRLLSARGLRGLFPPDVEVRIFRQRITFWPETLLAFFRRVR